MIVPKLVQQGAVRLGSGLLVPSGGFLPTHLGGLRMWVAADIGLDLTDGDPVMVWPDQSGNGNDLIQGAGAKRPIYKTGLVNGRPAMRFDGADDFIDAAFVLVQPEYVFCVFNMTADAAGSNPFDGFAGVNSLRLYRSGVGPALTMNAGANLGPITINLTDYFISGCLFNATNGQFRINGGNLAAGNTGGIDGDGIRVGEEPFQGDIAEVIVYNTTLSAVDRQRVERYLSMKYAISLS